MSDPLRSDGSRAHARCRVRTRIATRKIEQLLLVGLDHYFAGPLRAGDQRLDARAVSRSRPRPRARLHRARAQRAGRAPARIGRAAARTASPRSSAAKATRRGGCCRRRSTAARPPKKRSPCSIARPSRSGGRRRRPSARSDRPPRERRPRRGARQGALCRRASAHRRHRRRGGGSRGQRLARLDAISFDWRSFGGLARAARPEPAPVALAPVARDAALPLPRRGEMALQRARALAAGGHLRDALVDSRRGAADRSPAARCRSPARRHSAAVARVDARAVRRCTGSREG